MVYWLSVLLLSLLVSCSTGKLTRQAAAELQANLGIEYFRLGKLNVALEKLQAAVDSDPDNVKAQDALAVLYEKIKQYDAAKKHFQAAIVLQPDNPSTQNNFGRFLCEQGEFNQGLAYLKQAMYLPLNDKKWFAFTNAGRCELQRGNAEQAEHYFRQALEYDSHFAPALLELQALSYRQGNLLSARAFLERYLEVAAHTPETLSVGFTTEKALGNATLAEQYRQLLLQNFPSSPAAQQLKAAE